MADSQDNTEKDPVGRRDFFKEAAIGAAAIVAGGSSSSTAEAAPAPPRPGVIVPSDAQATVELGTT
ncbi:MAG: twin-arginine translocation signal domain-containing protein, partial [Vicinamibacterales bacterium]